MRLLLSFLILACCVGCDRSRTRTRYEIPKGYKGWAFVFWERSDAPRLPNDNGRVAIRFSKDGIVQTSSSDLDGWATDEYYWLSPNGSLVYFGKTGSPLVDGQGGGTLNVGSKRQIKFSYLYVGDDYSPTMTHDNSLEIALQKAGMTEEGAPSNGG